MKNSEVLESLKNSKSDHFKAGFFKILGILGTGKEIYENYLNDKVNLSPSKITFKDMIKESFKESFFPVLSKDIPQRKEFLEDLVTLWKLLRKPKLVSRGPLPEDIIVPRNLYFLESYYENDGRIEPEDIKQLMQYPEFSNLLQNKIAWLKEKKYQNYFGFNFKADYIAMITFEHNKWMFPYFFKRYENIEKFMEEGRSCKSWIDVFVKNYERIGEAFDDFFIIPEDTLINYSLSYWPDVDIENPKGNFKKFLDKAKTLDEKDRNNETIIGRRVDDLKMCYDILSD
ncbi:MAG: hypothetical protein N4A44_00545 [Alphaproteobacteria bacterium]|jgi:hypothetical protein|nr:hypothetical protein [Alphaproteobacteria bacterium]